MRINSTAFLCGYFTTNGCFTGDTRWLPVGIAENEEAVLRNYYFPEFVDFFAKKVQRYVYELHRGIQVPLKSGDALPITVERIHLWTLPSSLAIFSIEITIEDKEASAVTEGMNLLRDCAHYEQSGINDYLTIAISPIQSVYQAVCKGGVSQSVKYDSLVENGNKLKIFQIVDSQECPDDFGERDLWLYALGTLSRYDGSRQNSIDPRYYERIMKTHRLGVFSSWTALALLDTVTFFGKGVSSIQRNIWKEDYFEMIYIYELFRKCFLYRHNLRFRTGVKNPRTLQTELNGFERQFTFTSISYNFLPNDVDKAIVRGLDLKKEETSLAKLVAEEVIAREEESSMKKERFLLFLTCLASLSAVWDISCLLDQVINYQYAFPAPNWGYRIFSSLVLILIILVAWKSVRKRK